MRFALASFFQLTLAALIVTTALTAQANSTAIKLPPLETALRVIDTVLMEPAFTHAHTLANDWLLYQEKLNSDPKRAAELETLANEPAIIGLLRDPQGPFAPVFREEIDALIGNWHNGVMTAWRLRSVDDKIIYAHKAERLVPIDTSVLRREIGMHFVSIPITGAGNNYILDAEWDCTRLPDFPLSHTHSEFLFLQTDNTMQLVAADTQRTVVSPFIAGDRFIAAPFGVQQRQRIYFTQGKNFRLIIIYPFAGYIFYAVRGVVVLLILVAIIFAIVKARHARRAAAHVAENRSSAWLGEHYQRSLNMNEESLALTDKTLSLVNDLKGREERIIGELGKHLQELGSGFKAEAKLLFEENARGANVPTAPAASTRTTPESLKPLHKPTIRRDPILIHPEQKPEIYVSLELDLPLKQESELSPAEKAAYVASLKRRASSASGKKEYIHDEKIDDYDYTPPGPIELPKPQLPGANDKPPSNADLEFIQKFRYSAKARVLSLDGSNENPNRQK